MRQSAQRHKASIGSNPRVPGRPRDAAKAPARHGIASGASQDVRAQTLKQTRGQTGQQPPKCAADPKGADA